MHITVIGAGNMGGALLRGWYRAIMIGRLQVSLTATAHTDATLARLKADCPNITTTTDNTVAVDGADVVVLAVKPWLVAEVAEELLPSLRGRDVTIVSVAAGIPNDQLRELFGDELPCVYAMPNIAAAYGESMTFVEETPDSPASQTAHQLFSLVGESRIVPLRQMDPGMMMAGCGIAYVMRFVRAMQEGGVEMGFYPAQAREIALQTMAGAVALLRATGEHPEVAIDRVTTPGGYTIRGLNALDQGGFNAAVVNALKAGLK